MCFFGSIYKPWDSNRVSVGRERKKILVSAKQKTFPTGETVRLGRKGKMKGKLFKRLTTVKEQLVIWGFLCQHSAKCMRIRAVRVLGTHQTQFYPWEIKKMRPRDPEWFAQVHTEKVGLFIWYILNICWTNNHLCQGGSFIGLEFWRQFWT